MPPFSHISHSLKKTDSLLTPSPTVTNQNSSKRTTTEQLTCHQCKEVKSVFHFHKRARSANGYRRECRDCRSAHRRLLRSNKETRRELAKKQNDACAICGRVDEADGKSLALDHDHETKTIRGLLCMRCNTGIALLGEEPTVLLQAARYLRKHAAPPPMPEV
jgi:hypothetical protein